MRKYYSSFKGSWSNRPQKILSPEVWMCVGVIVDNLNSVFYSSTSFFFRPSHVCATCAAPTSTDSTPAFTVSSSPALPKNTSTSMPRAKDIISVWHAHTHSLPAGAAGAGFGVAAFVVQRVSQQTIRPVIRPLCLCKVCSYLLITKTLCTTYVLTHSSYYTAAHPKSEKFYTFL